MTVLASVRGSAGAAIGSGALLLALTGCGGSSSSTAAVADTLEAQLGTIGVAVDPGSLTCEGAGELKQGASLNCGFTTDGQPVGLVAAVTSVEGSKASFEVSTAAKAVPAAVLARAVQARAGAQLGATVPAAECSGDLEPTVRKSTTCTLTSGPTTRKVTVTVTSIDGGVINYTMDAA